MSDGRSIVNTGEWPPVIAWLDSLSDGRFAVPLGSRPPITRESNGALHVCRPDGCWLAPVGATVIACDDGTFTITGGVPVDA